MVAPSHMPHQFVHHHISSPIVRLLVCQINNRTSPDILARYFTLYLVFSFTFNNASNANNKQQQQIHRLTSSSRHASPSQLVSLCICRV